MARRHRTLVVTGRVRDAGRSFGLSWRGPGIRSAIREPGNDAALLPGLALDRASALAAGRSTHVLRAASGRLRGLAPGVSWNAARFNSGNRWLRRNSCAVAAA